MQTYGAQLQLPLPRRMKGRPPVYPWASMAVGESFFVPLTEANLRNQIGKANQTHHPRHFVLRKRKERGREGYRVWRDR